MSKTIKISLISAIFVLVASAGYAFWQKKPMVSESRFSEDDLLVKNKQNQQFSTKSMDNSFFIPEAGIKILFPDKYFLSKSKEHNRRGSFVSYEFNKSGEYSTPHLDELQFFSENSIKSFLKNCEGVVCFFGDYPDLERYYEQKMALMQSRDYQNFKLQNLDNRNWLVSSHECVGDSCVIREYTTFLDEMKLDVWIIMASPKEENQADELFSQFMIE